MGHLLIHRDIGRRDPRLPRLFIVTLCASASVHAFILGILPPLNDMPPLPIVASLDVTLRSPQAKPEATIPQELRKPLQYARSNRASRMAPATAKTRVQQVAPPASTPSPEIRARAEPPDSQPAVAQGKPQAPTITLVPAGGTDARSVIRTEQQEMVAAIKPAEVLVPPTYHAAYLRNPPPRYPLAARLNGEEGTVMLKVLVTQQGLPASVTVEKTSGFPLLDAAAVQTVRQWRFVPARRGEQAIDASVVVPIRFRLQDAS